MLIKVLRQAFYGGILRERGVTMDWPDTEPVPKWAKAIEPPVAPAVEADPQIEVDPDDKAGDPDPGRGEFVKREPTELDEEI